MERFRKKGKAPVADYRRSKAQLASAAESFRKLVREFPREPRTAAALYSLGKTLSRLDDDGAIMYFEQLIANHKNSPLVADTYLSMGEFYFDKHQIDKAIALTKALSSTKTIKPILMVYTSWDGPTITQHQKMTETPKIISLNQLPRFKLTVKLADADKRRKISRIDLRQEAIKDLVMVWQKAKIPKQLGPTFAPLAKRSHSTTCSND